ncbi:Cleavage polyadenylation factor subunit clp1 [Vermiconidia calcicola]|uniref:Cleavage polyadenylation factor subunit clp1 n=1 Tax=Vermiconidia calcicola TaxID=1690605 RepID=A0ACC3NR23_9PEZI|nr:Cleavage polyadenylation factor subunit clp1 [Vermiconidia calcicola]
MALPGLSLPGLGLSQAQSSAGLYTGSSSLTQESRMEDLAPRTEWRFEVSFQQQYTIRVTSGHAELFGVELAPNQPYTFSGCKAAILTWHGCQLEVSGDAESEYLGQETEYAVEWLNVHGMLETARDDAQMHSSEGGPRVLVVGPDFVGKSSLVRSLAGWAVTYGRTPTIVNLDPREGLLTPPGSFTAVTVGSQLEVENGFGISPISGPTITPVKTPLVYHCPYSAPPEKPDVYKALITRTALSVTNKLEENSGAKQSGLIIDTPGTLNDPKSNYDIITHLVSEFSITLILTLGSERLFNDMNRKFGQQSSEAIPVLRISKPGGAVERDAAFMKQLQNQQIRQYFFGTSKDSLNPHSHTYSFAELNIFRANSPSLAASSSSMDMDASDAPYASHADFERMTPNMEMLGRLVAIKFCSGSETDEFALRDSPVMGFAYVSEVDEAKKRVRFLAPHPQKWGDRAVVWGGWPQAVTDLVGSGTKQY